MLGEQRSANTNVAAAAFFAIACVGSCTGAVYAWDAVPSVLLAALSVLLAASAVRSLIVWRRSHRRVRSAQSGTGELISEDPFRRIWSIIFVACLAVMGVGLVYHLVGLWRARAHLESSAPLEHGKTPLDGAKGEAPKTIDEAREQLLHGQSAISRSRAAKFIAGLGSSAAPAVPELKHALADRSYKVRAQAIIALANIGREARSAIPLLEKCAKDGENVGVQLLAVEALKKLNSISEGDQVKGSREVELEK